MHSSYGGDCWYSSSIADEQRREKEGFLPWSSYLVGRLCYGGRLLSYPSCALQQLCPGVLARGTGELRPTSRSRLCFCGCLLRGVRGFNVCAQYDLIYVHRVGPVLSGKVGHPFSCMPFTACPYMKSLFFGCWMTVQLWWDVFFSCCWSCIFTTWFRPLQSSGYLNGGCDRFRAAQ